MNKKETIKNIVIISFILFLAVFSTYKIYYHFNDEETFDYSSKSLDITFHEKNGQELELTKVTPLTDALGLSSPAHIITVVNNLTEPVDYMLKITDNLERIKEDSCEAEKIPKSEIKISIKKNNEDTEIYTLEELEDTMLVQTIPALKEDKYSIRIWIASDTTIQSGSNHHYHGLIEVYEDESLDE